MNPNISMFLTYSSFAPSGGQVNYPAKGWYSMDYGNADRNTQGVSAFAFSGGTANEGAAQFWTPNGLYVGVNKSGQKRSFFQPSEKV